MKFLDLINDSEAQHLNLVILLSDSEETSISETTIKTTERAFYKNKNSVVGYKFYKPISKLLEDDFSKKIY